MNNKVFLALFTLLALLFTFGLYSKDENVKVSNVPIPGIDTSKINSLEIFNSKSKLKLKLINNTWHVSDEFDYKANTSKVNSLLLKLLSPQSIQHIPYSESGVRKLGLSDKSETTFDVNLLDGTKSLAQIRLGMIRAKNPENPGQFQTSSQYAILKDSKSVMLLKNAISTNAEKSKWISVDLINILSNRVFLVENYELSSEEKTLVYSISRPTEEEIELNLEIPEGKKVIKTLVSQAFNALENLTIENVFTSKSEVEFDRVSKYSLRNGLVYSLYTSNKEGLTKLTVDFDVQVYQDAKKLFEEWKKQNKESKVGNEKAKETKLNEEKKVGKEVKLENEITSSSKEDAAKLNQIFNKWHYKIPEYSFSKFRKEKSSFFEDLIVEGNKGPKK